MVTLNPQVTVLEVDGEYIIVDAASGRYLGANRTANEMLSIISQGMSEDDAIRALEGLMDVDEPTLRVDYTTFANTLVELELASSA